MHLTTRQVNRRSQWNPLNKGKQGKVARPGKLPPPIATVRDAVAQAASLTEGVLVFLPSALESAEDSPFVHPEKVFQALLGLGRVARHVVGDRLEGKKSGPLGKLFEAVGLRYIARISKPTKNLYPEEYKVKYKSRFVLIESHFTLGGGRSPATCLSIHFHVDQSKNGWLPVVAHCGRHKPTVT